jgi:hypothetical protein
VTNSDPKVEVSTVRCDFEYQTIGDLFKYIDIPVCNLQVILLRVWLASTNMFICTGIPLGNGELEG